MNLFPSDGAADAALSITIDWFDVPDAINYDLYLGTTDPPGLMAAGLIVSEFPATLDPGTDYYWFVVANKICWKKDAGPVWSFSSHPGYTISGTVSYDGYGLENVEMTNLPNSPLTDSSGDYSCQVESGWSGTVSPVLSGYIFEPDSRQYTSVTSSQTGHNYSAYPSTDNAPTSYQVLPEVIWAGSGGSAWMTEVQITDMTGGSVVDVYFNPGGGVRRGPIALWDNSGGSSQSSYKCANLLETINALDTGYDYSNKVGAMEFRTQDSSKHIHVSARTLKGDFSKTFPGFLFVDENIISSSQGLMVQNLVTNSEYRTAFGAYNTSAHSADIEFKLYDSSGSQIGSTISKTLGGYDFQAFNPFTEAGLSGDYDNVFLKATRVSGIGIVMVYGATANQNTSDPAAHFAVKR